MINIEKNQPHGFGRAIRTDNSKFIDEQFKDGVDYGYTRDIW
jgi:hypothetical protein